eukprot:GHVU01166662.1.p1 GENE.GHVU01166662.1~~GHVU01166662.1.p1  ORF type:complete len:433 (-),score=40.84 GHVU01166662.1:844-2142(-)
MEDHERAAAPRPPPLSRPRRSKPSASGEYAHRATGTQQHGSASREAKHKQTLVERLKYLDADPLFRHPPAFDLCVPVRSCAPTLLNTPIPSSEVYRYSPSALELFDIDNDPHVACGSAVHLIHAFLGKAVEGSPDAPRCASTASSSDAAKGPRNSNTVCAADLELFPQYLGRVPDSSAGSAKRRGAPHHRTGPAGGGRRSSLGSNTFDLRVAPNAAEAPHTGTRRPQGTGGALEIGMRHPSKPGVTLKRIRALVPDTGLASNRYAAVTLQDFGDAHHAKFGVALRPVGTAGSAATDGVVHMCYEKSGRSSEEKLASSPTVEGGGGGDEDVTSLVHEYTYVRDYKASAAPDAGQPESYSYYLLQFPPASSCKIEMKDGAGGAEVVTCTAIEGARTILNKAGFQKDLRDDLLRVKIEDRVRQKKEEVNQVKAEG